MVCYDTLFHEAAARKEDKYLDFLSAIRNAGYNAKLITVEVGSRGLPNKCGFEKLRKELKLTRTRLMTSWSKQQREQWLAHLLYSAVETVFIITLFVCGMFKYRIAGNYCRSLNLVVWLQTKHKKYWWNLNLAVAPHSVLRQYGHCHYIARMFIRECFLSSCLPRVRRFTRTITGSVLALS